ncbi:MAG: hypothetical protein GY716_12885 [bacterium]|nr:hypothetical protein [bacterium]
MRRRSEQSGFTLIEVLIAGVIMVVGILGLMAMFPQSYATVTNSGRLSAIGHLASQQLEELRSLDYADTELSTGTHPAQSTDSGGSRYYAASGFDENFSLRWIVSAGPTDSSGTAVAAMKTIVVEATYGVRYDNSGKVLANDDGLTVRLNTLVAE